MGPGRDSGLRAHVLALSSAGIAVGFYGNGETSDGVHRATYSLRHANRTVMGVQDRVSGLGRCLGCRLILCMPVGGEPGACIWPQFWPSWWQVWDTAAALNRTAEPSLQSLERQLAGKPEPLRAVQRLQGLLETLLGYTAAIPFWRNPGVSLEVLAEQVDLYDWYRYSHVLFPACPVHLVSHHLITLFCTLFLVLNT